MTTQNLNNISSGNGLFSEGNKPLPESILFNFQWGHVAFTSVHFRREFSRYLSWYEFENYLFKITAASPRGPWVDMERVVMSCCHDVHWYGWSSDLLCCQNLQMSLLIAAQQSYIPFGPPSITQLAHTDKPTYVMEILYWVDIVLGHDITSATQIMVHANAVYPIKYKHGFVLLCLDAITLSVIIRFLYWIYHILQGYFTGTGAIIWLPQCQWSNPEGYGHKWPVLNLSKTQQNTKQGYNSWDVLYQ